MGSSVRRKIAGKATAPGTPPPEAADRPEWLPEDWTMELRKRGKSCIKRKRFDRYYICPLSGKKFRSKPEVIHFLNNKMLKLPASESASWEGGHKQLACREVDHSPGGLPDGWIKETRSRKNGGITDSHYIDPVNGYGFCSKKHVFRYLQNKGIFKIKYYICPLSGKKFRSKPEVIHFLNNKMLKLPASESASWEGGHKQLACREVDHSPGGLPDGWIKETRSRKNGGITDSPIVEFEKSKVKRAVSKRCLFAREGPISIESTKIQYTNSSEKPDSLLIHEEPIDDARADTKSTEPPAKPVSSSLSDASAQFAAENGASETSCVATKNIEQLEQKIETVQIECHQDPAFQVDELQEQSAIMLPEPENENLSMPLQQIQPKRLKIPSNTEASQSVTNHAGQQKRKSEKSETMHVCSSKRLAGVSADPAPSFETQKQTTRARAKKIEQAEAKSTVPEGLDVSITNEPGEKLEGLKPFVKPSNEQQADQKDKDAPETNELPEKAEKLEPFVEQAPLEDPGPVDSSVTLPFGDCWPDPCIEFAFKTLTSDFPVLEDIAAIQDYYNHQLVSSQNQHGARPVASDGQDRPYPLENVKPLENGNNPDKTM